ncbi:threonine export protein RhtC [Serratia microhaemolytica]|uniref:threonine export protein RhtC n=1 Tax=Serratia microhaemolytica TaxID=2675110 RepID=UPI000FDEB548|nr:threonine export protein RhtC [Serratia microhaemolytica]
MLTLFSVVALIHLIALMTPGPDFFFISQTALSRSRAEAMMGVLGITLGVMIWAALALLGLQLLLQQIAGLQRFIMLAGGLYLCWLGWQLLRSAYDRHQQHEETEATAITLPQPGRSLLRGLLTNLSNPKALIYTSSVFSLFIGNEVETTTRWGLFALITLETFAWFTLVAIVFALPTMRQTYQRLAKWIDALAGGLFIAFGLHLIFYH